MATVMPAAWTQPRPFAHKPRGPTSNCLLGPGAGVGCTRVSLTVTSWNREAIEFYRKMGFVRNRIFMAGVWEGFASGS